MPGSDVVFDDLDVGIEAEDSVVWEWTWTNNEEKTPFIGEIILDGKICCAEVK